MQSRLPTIYQIPPSAYAGCTPILFQVSLMLFWGQNSLKLVNTLYLCDPDPFFWRGKIFLLAIFVYDIFQLYTTVLLVGGMPSSKYAFYPSGSVTTCPDQDWDGDIPCCVIRAAEQSSGQQWGDPAPGTDVLQSACSTAALQHRGVTAGGESGAAAADCSGCSGCSSGGAGISFYSVRSARLDPVDPAPRSRSQQTLTNQAAEQPRTCDLLTIAEAAQVPLQASRPDLTTMSYKSVIWPLQNLLGWLRTAVVLTNCE